jgi:membrane fusion protein, macrolide-specific efflux system
MSDIYYFPHTESPLMNDSSNAPHARRRKSKRSRNAIIAGAVVLVAGATWFGVHAYRAKAAKEGEYLFAPVQTGDIEDLVTATGTLEPRDYVDVGAQVSGQIDKLNVEVGDMVKAGDVLASIDATTSEARVEANEASLRSAKASLETQKNNLEKAQRDYERQQNLFKEDATTAESLANAKTAFENAQHQIDQSKAQIEQQAANMRIEATNLKYTKIIAPIDGTVMSIAVKEGQTINATQQAPTVLRLANLNTMTVRTDVSEADVSKLQKGMNVYFTTLGAGSNRRWYGTLKRIEPTPKTQNSVVLYPVLFDVQNEGSSLMPSMTAQVFFVVSQARNVLTVPMAALQQGQQIARELAAKQQQDGKKPAGMPGVPGAPGAAAANTAAGGGPAAPGAVASGSTTAGAPGGASGEQGNRPPGNGDPARAGQPGGGFGGQRPGGGGFGGFNAQNMTPEQREEMIRRFREQGGGGGAGFGRFGGGAPGGGGGVTRQPQQRRGTVMVKLADGKLEPRQVVIGVTDRIRGQVLEGLKEGEEVVVGKRDQTPATPASTPTQNFDPRRGGGFPGGGFRPF